MKCANPYRRLFVAISFCLVCVGVECVVSAEESPEVKSQGEVDFRLPEPLYPYFHLHSSFPPNSYEPFSIQSIEVNEEPIKYYRALRSLKERFPDEEAVRAVEANDGTISTAGGFSVDIPYQWIKGESVLVRVSGTTPGGESQTLTAQGKPAWESVGKKGWKHYAALVIEETEGLERKGEPVQVMLGFVSKRLADPRRELRVVTRQPEHPDADELGFVEVPCQVLGVTPWNNRELLDQEEKDSQTGEVIRRYMPTTTVHLVFLANAKPYEERVYLVCYGNPTAKEPVYSTQLSVRGKDLGQTISNERYRIGLATASGAIETVTLKGEPEVLLEHKLETNGAVHWNPGVYAPPDPWVHASDWEHPKTQIQTGPLVHRISRYADLPLITTAAAQITYQFFAGQPYVLSESVMEIKEDIFVQALRNGEIVFNHAVLDEFVWKDERGEVQSLDLAKARKHPVHGLEIPPDVPWLAFINRQKGVGFAGIPVKYENFNLYGELPSVEQPYIYVQIGPWIYWSRALVYPFGHANFTRMMPVRKGSVYVELSAYLPFHLAKGDDPFAELERYQRILTKPLRVTEHSPLDPDTPRQWIEPLLTAPFDEGVEGAKDAGTVPKD